MNAAARKPILAGSAIAAAILAALAFSYGFYQDQRAAAADQAGELAACRQYAAQIEAARGSSAGRPGHPAAPFDLPRAIADAAGRAGLPDDGIESIHPDPSRTSAGGLVTESPTRLSLHHLTLIQVLDLLARVDRRDEGLRVDKLHIEAETGPSGFNTWSADALLIRAAAARARECQNTLTTLSSRPMRMIIVTVLCAVTLTACRAPTPVAVQNQYQTIAADPRRDTDAARRLDDAALKSMEKGDYKGAEPLLRQALLKDVTFGPAHNNLGMVYFHQSRLYLAAWEFQYAIKLMPNQPEAHNNLGLVFEAGGKLDQAVEAYDLAVKADPDNPQFIGNSARARIRRGDTGPEVRALLGKVVELDTRPEWVAWARERLRLMKPTDGLPLTQEAR